MSFVFKDFPVNQRFLKVLLFANQCIRKLVFPNLESVFHELLKFPFPRLNNFPVSDIQLPLVLNLIFSR